MRTILLVTVLIATATSVLAAPKATIMVRPEAETAAGSAVLSDLATVECEDQELAQKLGEVEVCSAPLPGYSRTLTKEQILISLRRAGVSDGSVDLLSPTEITVSRKAFTVTGQALFDAAKEFVLATHSLPGKVDVEPTRLQADQTVPAGDVELKVKPGSREPRKGRNSLPVEIVVNGEVYRTICVSVNVKVIAQVLVATRAISRSEVLTGDSISLQELDITDLSSDVLTEMPEDDWTATTSISEGSVIRQSWIDRPPAVKYGEAVLVVVQSGKVRVTDKGTALQDGRPGERIRVRLLGNTRDVRGMVTERGIVKITIR